LVEDTQPTVGQKIARGLAWNSFRTVFSAVLSLVYSVIAVRFLHVQNFGVIAFLDSIFSLLGAFFMPLTHQAEQRYIPELMAEGKYPQVRQLIKVGQRINILLAFGFAFPFLAFAGPIASSLGNPAWAFYIQLMAIAMIISAGLGILKAILNAFYDQRFLSIWESFFSATSLVLLITFVVFFHWGVTGAILVGIITYGASGMLYFYRMSSRYAHNVKGESMPIGKTLEIRIRKYVVPSAAIGLMTQFASYYGGVVFLGLFTNATDVAYFDIPNTFVQRAFGQVSLVIGALSLVSLVEVNARDSTKLKAAASQFTKFVSIYALPVMAGGFVLASPIMTVLYGSQVLPAVLPFRVLLVESCISTILQISGTLLFVLEKAYRVFLWTALDIVILFGLNILLIPPMGVMGAVIAVSVSDVIYGVIITHDAWTRFKVGSFLPLGAIVKMSLASLIMAVVVYAMGFVFPVVNVVSLAVAMTIGVVVYLCGLRILQVFNDTDRRMVESSSLPLKGLLLRLLWKAK
jgi:O-antigen/teichoic acid export membrane protein